MNTITATLAHEIIAYYRGREFWALPGREITLTEDALERAIAGHRVRVNIGNHRHGFATIDQINCA